MRSWLCSLPTVCRIDRVHAGMSRVCAVRQHRSDERRLTPPPLTSPRSAVIFVEKAAAACAAPALKHFCSILHHNLAFTQNLGLTLVAGVLFLAKRMKSQPVWSVGSIRSFPWVGQADTSASKKPRTGFAVIFRFAISRS